MRTHIAGFLAALCTLTLAAQDESDLFTKLDTNKDGFVTADEVPEANKTLFERLLRNADNNSDGKLSKEEFQAGLRPAEGPRPPLDGGAGRPGFPGNPGPRPDPREIFNRWDANKDGKLTKDEVPERAENFSRLDANGDGSVSQEEFAEFGRLFGPRPPGAPNQVNPLELEALFDRTDSNSDGKLTKDEIPEERQGMRAILERSGGDSLTKAQFVRGMLAMSQNPGQPPRPDGAPPRRPDGAPGGPLPGNPGARPDPREIFKQMDVNKDGKLTKEEMGPRTRTPEDFARVDANGDGFVSQEEFVEISRRFSPRPPGAPNQANPANQTNPQVFEALFDRTDSNSDGKLTKDEIPEERQGMRMVLERAGDSITKEQFVRGMMAMTQNPGQPPRPEGATRPEGPPRPEGAPPRRPDGAPAGPFGGPPPGGLFAALDTDRDGQLSNAEIVGAGSALLKLDRNNDGKLTPDEVFTGGPGGPPGRPGDGGPGQRRPGDGPRPDAPPGERPPVGRGSLDAPPGQRRPGQRGPGGQSPEAFRDRLKQADTNGDGKLSKDEAPPFLKERFDSLDANSDGFLDQEESRRLLDQRPTGGAPPNRRPNGDQPRRPDGDKK